MRTVQCIKLGREAEGLEKPPFPGALGEKIFAQVSQEAWSQWVAHQTMLINENRLSLMEPEARKFLQTELQAYFFGGGSKPPQGYVPPAD